MNRTGFAALIFAVVILAGFGGGGTSMQTAAPAPRPRKILFIGDSITYLWAQDPSFAVAGWSASAIVGETSAHMAARFDADVIAAHPDVVHILVGTNDVYPPWELCSRGVDTCGAFRQMVASAHGHHIAVIIGTIPPWGPGGLAVADPDPARFERIADLNRWLVHFAREQGVAVADYHAVLSTVAGLYAAGLSSDGVHPNQRGYAAMMPVVRDAIGSLTLRPSEAPRR